MPTVREKLHRSTNVEQKQNSERFSRSVNFGLEALASAEMMYNSTSANVEQKPQINDSNNHKSFHNYHTNVKGQIDDQQRVDELHISSRNTVDLDRGVVNIRQRPQIPPKPQMDAVRYSMANVQESCDWELDTLLNELSALERQLNTSSGADQLILGLPALPVCKENNSRNNHENVNCLNEQQDTRRRFVTVGSDHNAAIIAPDCPSPDHDSAFGDSSSTESRNLLCRNSAVSSTDSCRGSINTPSPIQQISPNQQNCSTSSTLDVAPNTRTKSEIKATKIREALEKMREADIKKIYVKFFLDDGATTISMLIDERWTVAEVLRQIASKQKVALTEQHAIVEELPELYLTRIYEDHEYIVENILMWVANSPNKLYFTRRPDKYVFIERPAEFLVCERNIDILSKGPPSPVTKREVVKDFFENNHIEPPDMEGWLHLKSDARKSWKKYFFVLRSSGLYYSSKGKSRNSKDLQCLMNMQTNQVYVCSEWKRKYKAPTNFGFAIKHPKIQVKASKYIKYVCASDAITFHKWMSALRIAKNGRQLYDNYNIMKRYIERVSSQLIKVDIPQVKMDVALRCDRSSIIERAKSCNHCDTPPLLNMSGQQMAWERSSKVSPYTTNSDPSSSVHSTLFDQSDEMFTGTIKRAPCDFMVHYRRQSGNLDRCGSSCGTGSPSVRSVGDIADSDSDEEQFPPPPPVATTPLPPPEPAVNGLLYSPSAFTSSFIQPKSAYSGASPSTTVMPALEGAPTPPTKHFSIQDGKVCVNSGRSNILSPTSPTNEKVRKVPPPPPPKRADTTRMLLTNSNALHSELEVAMARRLQKIEQH